MKKMLMLFAAALICTLSVAQPSSNPLFLADFGYTNGGWRVGETVRIAADVNGDGKADILGFSGNAVRVAFSNGTNFGPVQILNQDFNGWSYQKHIRTAGDVNGDGKDDIIAFGDAGTFVAFSTGNGFAPLQNVFSDLGNVNGGWSAGETVRCVGDVNGDGKVDLVGFSGTAVRVAFSNGNSFNPVQILNQDFSGWSYANHVRTVADVNGDGRADLVGFGDQGTYVAFSTGNGFGPLTLVFNDLGTVSGWNTRMRRIMADMNGDHKADIVGFNTDHVVVCYSNGRGFEPLQVISNDFSNRTYFSFDKYEVTAADVNGDGAADLIGFGDKGVIVQLSPPSVSQSKLCCGRSLPIGNKFESDNHQYFLVFQTDGNLVVYKQNGSPTWASNTGGITATRCVMQEDGNLVIYNGSNPTWASNTNGHQNARLVMQDDGNLVIYQTDGASIWATNTAQAATVIETTVVSQPVKTDYVVTTLRGDYSADETIIVEYSGFKGVGGEWINIEPVGKPDNDWGDFQYVRDAAGRLKFDLSLKPGDYEVRAYRGSLDYNVAGRFKFTVH